MRRQIPRRAGAWKRSVLRKRDLLRSESVTLSPTIAVKVPIEPGRRPGLPSGLACLMVPSNSR